MMVFSPQEKLIFKKGSKLVVGIDEAGRGSLAGPVVAGAVAINYDGKNSFLPSFKLLAKRGIRDSKQLSKKQREKIFEMIKKEKNLQWQTSAVWPKVIDRINIGRATLLAWQRSLKKITPQPDFLFLDGKQRINNIEIEQETVIEGDQKIFLLSLASIAAKVNRDKLMERLDKKYPQYGFFQHKGYGTVFHLDRLNEFGPSPFHRKSCQPVFNSMPFKERICYIVSQIPKGKTMTYKEVALCAGKPKSFRAVGNILNKNRDKNIPCHRVIRSDGKFGGYNKGKEVKKKLLTREIKNPSFKEDLSYNF